MLSGVTRENKVDEDENQDKTKKLEIGVVSEVEWVATDVLKYEGRGRERAREREISDGFTIENVNDDGRWVDIVGYA